MFDETIRALRSLEGTREIKIPSGVVADAEGYIDRQCPHESCEFIFKVMREDWESDLVRDEEVFCPCCGHSAEAKQWYTYEQVEFQKQQALAVVAGKLNAALRKDTDGWNRRQNPRSFISIKMNLEDKWKQVEVPPSVSEPMRLQIGCSECGCRYAVIGAAYFCPGCGHNSAEQMFGQSLQGIRSTLDALKLLPDAIGNRDAAQVMSQAIVEAGLQNVVTAFQRYLESLYARKADKASPRRNAFQNLSEGSALWRDAFGSEYAAHLTAPELALLGRYFQQRHVLAHRQGLVDQAYVDKSGDNSYRVGQRVIVKEEGVREAVTLVERLAQGLASET